MVVAELVLEGKVDKAEHLVEHAWAELKGNVPLRDPRENLEDARADLEVQRAFESRGDEVVPEVDGDSDAKVAHDHG